MYQGDAVRVLATAAGSCSTDTRAATFVAVDERYGKTLWRMPLNATIKTFANHLRVGGRSSLLSLSVHIVCFGL